MDVFFVISGYLIGGGILRDLRQGSFSFGDFYTRRIKRIMPAYFTMILGVLAVGMLLYHYEPLESLGGATLRSSYFFANFFFYKYLGDYFSGSAESHALTNLWSLSTEEQFYIIIPFLMWGIWKLRGRAVLPVLAVLALLSFASAEHLLHSPYTRAHLKAFYMLEPRAWELLAGVLLAGVAPYDPRRQIRGGLCAVAGLASILGGYLFLHKGGHFPGAGALPCVIGAVLLIRYGACGPVKSLLQHRAAVGLGRISYSLYLWHWPVIVFMHYIWGEEPGVGIQLIAATLSIGVAYISWRFIEMPVRRSRSITTRKAFAWLFIVCVLAGGAGYVLKQTHGLVHLLHPSANRYASLEYPGRTEQMKPGYYGMQQLSGLPDEKGRMQNNTIVLLGDRSQKPEFILIGDSHAEALRSGLDDLCVEHGVAGLAVSAKTCPLTGVQFVNAFSSIADPFAEWLSRSPDIKTVFILCRWNARLSGAAQILYRPGEPIPADSSGNTALLEEGLRTTCARLRDMGREVVLLGPIPYLRFSPGTEMRRRIILGESTEDIGESVSQEEYLQHEQEIFRILQNIETAGLARVVWTHPALLQQGRYRGMLHDTLLYHDNNHLSRAGAQHVVRYIFPQLFPAAADR